MGADVTQSERLVAWLCKHAFLRLWSHPNQFEKKDKELCDSLIGCGDQFIVISVKEIDYKERDDATGWNRWTMAPTEATLDLNAASPGLSILRRGSVGGT